MKKLILILVIFYSATAQGQIFVNSTANQLYREIVIEKVIPHKFIGCYGKTSPSYEKIDSLRNILGSSKFVSLIDDDSYSLRYWAFITLLQQNDSLAFAFLSKQIKNDTVLAVQNSGNGFQELYKFNELLIDWYTCVIRLKYKEGLSGTINSVVFISPGKNIKKWKECNKNLNQVLKASGINMPLKKINCTSSP